MSKKLLLPGAVCAALATSFSTLASQPETTATVGQANAQRNASAPAKPKEAEADSSSAYYYSHTGEKISFHVSSGTVLLSMPASQAHTLAASAVSIQSQLQASVDTGIKVIADPTFENRMRVLQPPGTSADAILAALQTGDDVEFAAPLLLTNRGDEVGLTQQIVIRLTDGGALSTELQDDLATLGLTVVEEAPLTTGEYILAFSGELLDPTRFFEVVREAMELPGITWAEPNVEVTAKRQFTPNDPLYSSQWHLNNDGSQGGEVGADVNAEAGWNLARGARTVIAIHDDGVDLTHPDLPIWNNPGETGGGKENNGVDDDGNGYIDDYRGWDFTDDDNDPSPVASSDNHGTAVAGVAGASGNNGVGVSGTATNAQILPIRMTSGLCSEFAESVRYAAKYADAVNGSWSIGACQSEISAAIADGTAGTIAGSRRGDKGTPMLFATGNDASGWVKFTLSDIPAGTHDFEWRYVKDGSVSEGDDTMWVDEILWPGEVTPEGFEGGTSDFTTGGNANWALANDGVHARYPNASGNSYKAGTITHNQTTSLYANSKTVSAGTLTFWAWISAESYAFFNGNFFFWDGMEFYFNGVRQFRWAPFQGTHGNAVSFPASDANSIAVGATGDGFESGSESRSYYSQFGPEVDVVAPSSSNVGAGITTTDRQGAAGYDTGSDYTTGFGGTSSATPAAAGVVADILGVYPHLTATQLRTALRNGADEIGPYAYPSDRNDYYGHGRVNLQGSLDWLAANNPTMDCDFSDDLIAGQWSLIALPCLPTAPGTVTSAIGDDMDTAAYGTDWIMYEKSLVGDNNYTALTTASSVNQQRGYWIKSITGDAFEDNGAVDIAGTTTPLSTSEYGCPTTNGCYVITLNSPPGGEPHEWNMVAHPLAYAVDWADVRITVNGAGTIYMPSSAEAANIMSATYQIYTGSGYAPFNDTTPMMIGTLEPNQGIWVQTLPGAAGNVVRLLIPATPSLSYVLPDADNMPWYANVVNWLVPRAHAGEPRESRNARTAAYYKTEGLGLREQQRKNTQKRLENQEDWGVRLIARAPAEYLEDSNNVLGQLKNSRNGKDKHDLEERPPLGAPHLTIVFPHQNWNDAAGDYASDFKRPRERANWPFEVRSDKVGREVELCWEGPANILADSTLVDRDTREKYFPEGESGCTTIVMDTKVRSFRWKYKKR